MRTIPLDKSPTALALSADDRTLYVAHRIDGSPCEQCLSIVDTATGTFRAVTSGGSVSELALAPDQQHLFLAMIFEGLWVMDLSTYAKEPFSEEARRDICPMNLTLTPEGRRLYVSYQCYGPGGYPGHDSIATYDIVTRQRLALMNHLPNVGGEITLSPDAAQLWVNGNDACSQPAYDHLGCLVVPSGIMLVIDTRHNTVVHQLPFSISEGNGQAAFSPDGATALIGGGFFLKVVDVRNPDHYYLVGLNQGGTPVFTRNGSRAYVPVGGQDVVALLVHGGLPSAEVDKLTRLEDADIFKQMTLGTPPEEVLDLLKDRHLRFDYGRE